MPVLKNRPPKYGLHKPTGQAVVAIHGKRIYLGVHGSAASHQRYQEVLETWRAGLAPKPAPAPPPTPAVNEIVADLHQIKATTNDISLLELIVAYRLHAQEYYRKAGEITREAGMIDDACRILRRWLQQENQEAVLADRFGPLALEGVRDLMIDQGWTRITINKQVKRIQRMFKWGVSKELIEPGTYQRLQALAGLRKGRSRAKESTPVLPVPEDVVEQTLPHLQDVVADMVRLQQLTGARPGEVCNLRPCDIDRTEDVWRYVPSEHKMEHHDRQRVIFIGPRAQRILLPYLLRDAETYCFSPKESERIRRRRKTEARRTPLSCGNRVGSKCKALPGRAAGERYTAESYRRAIHRGCDLAFPPEPPLAQRRGESVRGRDKRLTGPQREQLAAWQSKHRWSPNQLRHLKATQVRSAYGLEAAQVTLGHSAADVTQIYAERDLALAARVARETG